jgi:hypothetical protein
MDIATVLFVLVVSLFAIGTCCIVTDIICNKDNKPIVIRTKKKEPQYYTVIPDDENFNIT